MWRSPKLLENIFMNILRQWENLVNLKSKETVIFLLSGYITRSKILFHSSQTIPVTFCEDRGKLEVAQNFAKLELVQS